VCDTIIKPKWEKYYVCMTLPSLLLDHVG